MTDSPRDRRRLLRPLPIFAAAVGVVMTGMLAYIVLPRARDAWILAELRRNGATLQTIWRRSSGILGPVGVPRDWSNSVSLSGMQISDETFRDLARLSRLQDLALIDCRLRDEQLLLLQDSQNIRAVALWASPIADEGLDHLCELRNLERLALRGSRITDAGLEHLAKSKNLKVLVLDETSVTDDGMKAVVGMSQLEILSLNQTGVTDRGLAHLHQLKRLRSVKLNDTGVSSNGVAALRKALPRCRIQWRSVTPRGPWHWPAEWGKRPNEPSAEEPSP